MNNQFNNTLIPAIIEMNNICHLMTDTLQHLTYDDFGQIIGNNRSGTAADMSYTYDNLHGWTTRLILS